MGTDERVSVAMIAICPSTGDVVWDEFEGLSFITLCCIFTKLWNRQPHAHRTGGKPGFRRCVRPLTRFPVDQTGPHEAIRALTAHEELEPCNREDDQTLHRVRGCFLTFLLRPSTTDNQPQALPYRASHAHRAVQEADGVHRRICPVVQVLHRDAHTCFGKLQEGLVHPYFAQYCKIIQYMCRGLDGRGHRLSEARSDSPRTIAQIPHHIQRGRCTPGNTVFRQIHGTNTHAAKREHPHESVRDFFHVAKLYANNVDVFAEKSIVMTPTTVRKAR